MKKLFATLLVFCMILTLFSACGNSTATASAESAAESAVEEAPAEEAAAEEEAPAEEAAAEEASAAEVPAEASVAEEEAEAEETVDYVSPFPLEEHATLTAWAMWIPGIEQYVDSPMDTSVFKAMEELTNVSIEMTLASSPETAMTEINLLIASGDYPDIINNLSGYYSAGLDSAIEQDVIVDILDYEDIMPNYFEKLRYRNAVEDATTEGGHIGVVYQVSKTSDAIQSGLTLRQDWIEELGAEVPTTYDELHDLLMQFKSEYNVTQPIYITKNGVPDTMFDGFGTELSYAMNNEEGSAPWNYVDNGDGLDVVFGYMDDSFYDVLDLLSTWYADGLFNADYLNNSYRVDADNLTSGEFGCLFATQQTLNAGNTFQEHAWAAYPNISVDGNAIVEPNEETAAIAAQGYSITTTCEDIELAAQWLDYQYCDETYNLNNYGIEGEGFEFDENGNPQLSDLVMNNPDGIAQAYTQFIYLSVTGSFYLDNDRFTSNYCVEARECNDIWKSAYDYYDTIYDTSAIQLSVEEQEDYAQIFSDISTYCSEAIAAFITGQNELTQESFDEFRDNLTSMNIDDCIAIYQAAADRYVEELNA